MDDAQEILPGWLRFVRGVVDSEDLPLNVSRELLQQDATTRFIKKQVVQKTIALLEELAAEGETEVEVAEAEAEGGGAKTKTNRYREFWGEFGRVLKEGVYHDAGAREQLAKLLRYDSSRGQGMTSLQDYVGRMLPEQKSIYYVAADSLASAQASPHIEALKQRGYEVLLMADPIDEWVVDVLREFAGKPLEPANRGALDLPADEQQQKQRETQQKDLGPLLARMHKVLDEQVKEVRVTDRLTDSPACLVSERHGISAHMERLLRGAGQDVPQQKRIFEINPEHAVVQRLRALADSDDGKFQRWTALLYDQALLAEGVLPADPATFARRVAELMAGA
jgi:molecular chaperone HtpG